MNYQEEWDAFLKQMISGAQNHYKSSKEYEYLEKQYDVISILFRDNLMEDERVMVEESIFQIQEAAEREKEILYRRGMRDCIFILKELGVLA